MNKKILCILGVCILLICSCSQKKAADTDLSWCKESIQNYNEQPIKKSHSYELIDSDKRVNSLTTLVDKTAEKTERKDIDSKQIYIFSVEDGQGYYYGSEDGDSWIKTPVEEDQVISELKSGDIAVSDESSYKMVSTEKENDKKLIKIEITTPIGEDNIVNMLAANGAVTEQMLQNQDLRKAYDQALEQKETKCFVWFDAETKEPYKQETNVSNTKIFLYYYYQLMGQGGNVSGKMPGYDSVPENVIAVVSFSATSDVIGETIELPQNITESY